MIRIYASGASRSRRALWVCEEAGAPYEIVELEWPPRINPGYLDINPAGTVPALVDGDVVLTESLVICEYVARKHKPDLVLEPGEPGYLQYAELLHFGEGTLQPTLAWARRFGPYSPEIVAHARDAFSIRLDLLDRALADGREWITGARFTCADISVGFPLIMAPGLGLGELMSDPVKAYQGRLKSRPAQQRAYAK